MGLRCSLVATVGTVLAGIGGGVLTGGGIIADWPGHPPGTSTHFPQLNQVTVQGGGRTKGAAWSVFEQIPGSLSTRGDDGLVGVG